MPAKFFLRFAALVIASAPLSAAAQDRTISGPLIVERPTLLSLGFEWNIQGDDNGNASVAVHYRIKGAREWREALPLLRLQNETIQGTVYANAPAPPAGVKAPPMTPEQIEDLREAEASVRYVTPNMFTGSILNLTPDTEYECRFTLTDPDGVIGPSEKTVTVRTRPEPMPATHGHVFHVYPVGWTGPKQEPSFTGLMAAYYLRAPHIDWQNAYPPRVKPGDTILVHAGMYKGDRAHYMNTAPHPGYLALGNLFDGTYYLTANGLPDKPIVIKGAGDGEVIFDGAGAQTLFNLMAANYNYFENITVRNTNVAFLLGIKNIAGSSGFTLKHSRIEDVGRAVQDDWSGSKDFYIADNVLIGRHDPEKMMSWTGSVWSAFPGFPEPLTSEYAVKIYGQGHVVAYNYVANWHDGIDIATYGVPDGTPHEIADRVPTAIDFYNNDFFNMGDNCMESDGGARNIRLFSNRCFNSAGGALSAQPMWGGPLYLYRNLIYNTPTSGSCKFSPASGILTYQNTFIGECRAGPATHMHFLNNLILASGSRMNNAQAAPLSYTLSVTTLTDTSTSDHNGFRLNPGTDVAFEWSEPASATSGTTRIHAYKTLADFQAATGQDTHSVLLDFDTFIKVSPPDTSAPQRLYHPEEFDFRLRPDSRAIDAGVPLPTITDGFTGAAPDLGAYEFGAPLPHYGPR